MLRRLIFVAVLAAFVLPIAVGPRPAHAQGYGYGGTTHVVKPGETLYSIAYNYGVDAMAIAQANGIANPNMIYAGQALIIPGGKPSHAPPPPHNPYPSYPAASCSYVVQPGDTLYSIAYEFGTTVGALMSANGLANENVIFIGQTLAIPGCSGHHGPPAHPGYDPGYPAYPSKGECGVYVTVMPGDTLSGIAARSGTTVYDIAAANGLRYPYTIYSGQTLFVPCGSSGYYPVAHPKAPYYAPHRKHYGKDDGHGEGKKEHVAACPREVQIVRPFQNAHLNGAVQVIGTAVIDDFQFYKVEFAAGHTPLDSSFNSINEVYTAPVSDTVLTTWFVDNLGSGPYTLRLTAVQNDGQFERPCDVKVWVD